MLKLLMIASFTAFGAMAAYAMPTLADTEEVAVGDEEGSDLSFSFSIEQILQDCGCGKGKGKGGK